MSRYRLLPTAEQAEHRRRARYACNLSVGQLPAADTSQRSSICGQVAPGDRKSQAVFKCEACTAGTPNANVNAVRDIAAGRAVTARGDLGASRSANREPQLWSPAA